MFSSGVVVMIVWGTVLVIRGGGTLGKIKQLAKSNRISATHRERKYVCVCVRYPNHRHTFYSGGGLPSQLGSTASNVATSRSK